MRYKLALTLLAVTSFAAVTPDEVARHKEWMDVSQDLKESIGEALGAKSASKATKAAAELTKILRLEEQYWIRARQDDAVKLAREDLEASRQIETFVRTGDMAQAAIAFRRLQETCSACHNLHLEQHLGQVRGH